MSGKLFIANFTIGATSVFSRLLQATMYHMFKNFAIFKSV